LRLAPLWGLGIALAAGYTNASHFLSLSRTLVFLPFFLLGAAMGPGHFAALARPRVRWAAGIVLVLGAAAAVAFARDVDVKWLYGSFAYRSLGQPGPWAALYRLGHLVAAGLLCLAFLALV